MPHGLVAPFILLVFITALPIAALLGVTPVEWTVLHFRRREVIVICKDRDNQTKQAA